MLNEYTYMFIFSSIVFSLFFRIESYELIVIKFKRIRLYFLYEMKRVFISLCVFFLCLSIFQTIFFILFDPLFGMMMLWYRNCVLLLLFFTFYLVIVVGKQKYYQIKLLLMYILWNTLYLIFLQNDTFSIFTPLQTCNWLELAKLISYICLVCYTVNLMSLKKGRRLLE